MNKPIKKHHQPVAYNYFEVRDYINEKYNVNIDDFKGKFTVKGMSDVPFQSFWHWICDTVAPNNGTYFYLDLNSDWFPEDEYRTKEGKAFVDFVPEILELFKKEFPNEEDGLLYCWVEW